MNELEKEIFTKLKNNNQVNQYDTFDPNLHLIKDLGWDSLDYVDVIWYLEEKYNLPEMDQENYSTIKTLGDLIKFVQTNKVA